MASSALDWVIAVQEKKQQDEQLQAQLISNAFAGLRNNLIESAKLQQQRESDLLGTRATLAGKGLRLVKNAQGQYDFQRDESLADPFEQLINRGRAADAILKQAELGIPPSQFGGEPALSQTGTSKASPVTTTESDNVIVQDRNILGVPTKTTTVGDIQKEESAKILARKNAELQFNKEALKKQLTPILALESTIPREEGGFKSFVQGVKNYASGILPSTAVGENIKTYVDEINRVTPLIARTSGDVANIAVNERTMSKSIFSSLFASKGLSEKKRALLTGLTNAVDAEDGEEIKRILNEENVPYFDLTTKKWVNLRNEEIPTFDTVAEAEAADIPIGAEVIIAGQKMRKE